jgi:hypothetical protein
MNKLGFTAHQGWIEDMAQWSLIALGTKGIAGAWDATN